MPYQSWEINNEKIIQRIYTNTNIPETWRIKILSSKNLKMIKKEDGRKENMNYKKFMGDSIKKIFKAISL